MAWPLLDSTTVSLNPLMTAFVTANVRYFDTAFINAIVEYHIVTISDPWPVTAYVTNTGLCHMSLPCQGRQRYTSTT